MITGASSGLGEATARLLAAQGASVALGARRVDRLRSLADELNGGGGKAMAVTTDVTDRDQVKGLVDAAVRAYGRIAVMINNAGIMPQAPLERLKVDEWDRMIDVNIKGVPYGSTSLSRVAAIDAATGRTRWVYDPETWKNGMPSNNGFVHRGVAYWADADDHRILYGTGDGYLIALDARTGRPISTFGQQGRIDLTEGLGRAVNRHRYGVSSPPIICRDVVVIGSKVHDFPLSKAMPPGAVRGGGHRPGDGLFGESLVPGERPSPTQPFPTRPAPFDRQGIAEDDVIDSTPELREDAMAVLRKYNDGPLYTPPSLQKPTIPMPGIAGGASWAGGAFDPETGMLYVPSITLPYAARLAKSPVPHADHAGTFAAVDSMQGIPLRKPPYGRITAIDLNTGDHRWMAPMGDLARSNPAWKQLGLPALGRAARGHTLLTKTLLIVGQEGNTQRESGARREGSAEPGVAQVPNLDVHEPTLCADDKATGQVVGEVALRRNASGAPMTDLRDGKQFLVVPNGGSDLPAELIVLCLAGRRGLHLAVLRPCSAGAGSVIGHARSGSIDRSDGDDGEAS